MSEVFCRPSLGFLSPAIILVYDFKTEVLFDLVDSLYRQKHGLAVTGNYSMRDLVEHERVHPAIVRRLDDMCRVVEI